MQTALSLAERNLGQTWPNPAVGCIIVKNGVIPGRGATARSGRPHAETLALQMAGDNAKGADVHVTLEPCAHHGATPPCAEALVKAGVRRVFIAMLDPDPRVNGKGVEILRNAGIGVTVGVCEKEARELNAGFIKKVTQGLPFTALKVATSLDGKIALQNGESKWITGREARDYGHLLRSRFDAVMTGIGTVLADDPELTCRLPGMEDRSPVRVVMDSNLKTPLTSKLLASLDKAPLWICASHGADADKRRTLERKGAKIIECLEENGRINLRDALEKLVAVGITRVMIEAGPRLATSLLSSTKSSQQAARSLVPRLIATVSRPSQEANNKILDEIYWFRATKILGGDGIDVFKDLGTQSLQDSLRFTCKSRLFLGDDTLEVLHP